MTATVAANMPPPMIEMMRRHHLTPEIPTPEDIAAASGADSAALVESFRRVLEVRGQAILDDADTAAIQAVLADSTVWQGGRNGGGWGKDEISSSRNGPAQKEGGESSVEVVDVYADGTHVVGVLELSASKGREDRPPIRQANVFHLKAAGEATHIWSLPADAAIADAFASGKPLTEHLNVALGDRPGDRWRLRRFYAALTYAPWPENRCKWPISAPSGPAFRGAGRFSGGCDVQVSGQGSI
jgi:hypothetical protein